MRNVTGCGSGVGRAQVGYCRRCSRAMTVPCSFVCGLPLVLLLCWPIGLCTAVAAVTLSPRIVHTHYGSLRGVVHQFNGPGLHPVEKFLGVPYATPPVNGLRFMPPLTPSSWDGVKTADQVASACPQSPLPAADLSARHHQRYWNEQIPPWKHSSEDCLYLNIFFPTLEGQLSSTEKPPVVVLVEAQTWQQSFANAIDASILATRGRLMVATVNFRLGVLGFLKTSPKESPQGNYGMLDVVAAVHWLRLNAAAFGGDAGRLTLIGIGQGAALVNLLMLSPVARGLFQGVVLLGGSGLSPTALQTHPEDIRQQMAAAANCWDPSTDSNSARYDLAPCLRRLSLNDLLTNANITNPRFVPTFAPFIDGFLPKSELRDLLRVRSEAFPDCDLLVGIASYELDKDLAPAAPLESWTDDRRDQILRTFVRNIYTYHNNEIFAVLRNEYTDWEVPVKSSLTVKHNLYESLSDGLVVASMTELLRFHAGLGNGRTYMYHLNYPSSHHEGSESQDGDLRGSFHGDDVFYLLGLPLLYSGSPEEAEVSEQLIAYVAGFCYAGDPNEHGGPYKDDKTGSGLIFWEPYTQSEQRYLSLGLRSRIRSHYRSHKMSVWLHLVPQLHQPGDDGVLMTHHHMRTGSATNNKSNREEDDRSYYDGIVRPLVMTRPPPATSSKGPENTTESGETPLTEVATTPECPTLPPYVAIATQQLNNTLKTVETSNSHNNTTAPSSGQWSYPAMIGLIASIGASLLFLNLMVIGCFCYLRHRSRRPLPHLDSTGSTITTTLATAKYDMVEVEKAAALKQLLVEVNSTDRSFSRPAACGGSAESVSSVIDLTVTHAPTCHSLCPSEYQVIQSASNDNPPHLHFRSALSLTDLQNHTPVPHTSLDEDHPISSHRSGQDFNARRVRMGHDRNASFHEITV